MARRTGVGLLRGRIRQFGSHVSLGLRLGARASVGIGLQHISNAGIEQPNGGIDFILLTASFAL